jgi:hypothetical protein
MGCSAIEEEEEEEWAYTEAMAAIFAFNHQRSYEKICHDSQSRYRD